jgi:hypothetical protein
MFLPSHESVLGSSEPEPAIAFSRERTSFGNAAVETDLKNSEMT